jgi:hypothetical protein
MPSHPELTDCSLLFRPLFSKRVWHSVQILIKGAILAVGSRTVTAVLRVMGLSEDQQFQRFHRVLNRNTWSTLQASRRLLMALIDAFAPPGPLPMALDDTIERRRGARIAARGIYRDPVWSSHSNVVKTNGLRWLCLMLVVPIPWAKRHWAMPFCSALTPSARYYAKRHRQPPTLTHRACQMLRLVHRWLPDRQAVIVADNSFSVLHLLAAVRRDVTMVTRLRLDAALYEPAPARRPGTRNGNRSRWLTGMGTCKSSLTSSLARPCGITAARPQCPCAGCWCVTHWASSRPRHFCVPMSKPVRRRF